MIKKILSLILCIIIVYASNICAFADKDRPVAYVVMDANTSEILMAENENEKYFPASTTKILTIALALQANRLEEKTVLQDDVRLGIEWDCAHANLVRQEEICLKDLIALASMKSANDACNGIATMISGSHESFVQLMNEQVKNLGLENTHFENPNGLHHENHYTTAKDLALIMKYCVQIDGFIEWTSLPEYTISTTNKHEAYTIKQNNPLLIKDSPYYIEGMQSCKTGFTDQAGYCMISFYEKDGQALIIVVLNENEKNNRVSNTYSLLKQVLENGVFIKSNQLVEHIQLNNILNQYFSPFNKISYRYECPVSGITTLSSENIILTYKAYQHIITDSKLLADVNVYHNQQFLFTIKVYAESWLVNKKLIYGVIMLIAGIVAIFMKKNKKG